MRGGERIWKLWWHLMKSSSSKKRSKANTFLISPRSDVRAGCWFFYDEARIPNQLCILQIVFLASGRSMNFPKLFFCRATFNCVDKWSGDNLHTRVFTSSHPTSMTWKFIKGQRLRRPFKPGKFVEKSSIKFTSMPIKVMVESPFLFLFRRPTKPFFRLVSRPTFALFPLTRYPCTFLSSGLYQPLPFLSES